MRARVLIADDDELMRNTLGRAFRDCEVVMAEDGLEAMAHLAENAGFQAIICDVLMPHCSGIEVYSQVCRLHPGLESRIVFITGGAFDPQDQHFLDSVPNQVVLKPFDLVQLRTLVGEIMAQ